LDKKVASSCLKGEYDYSERRACDLINLSRSGFRYQHISSPKEIELRDRIRDLATKKKRYGYRRIHVLLQRENIMVGINRVHRIWKDEGLQLPQKRPRKRNTGASGTVVHKARFKNHVWSWDFVFDSTEKGNRIKCLNVIDEYTRENLVIEVSGSIGSKKVISVLKQLISSRGKPAYIRSDNGPEFVANAVQKWLADIGSTIMYIKPGSPWENPYIESFNGKFRDECLNMHIFKNIHDARIKIGHWREEYNNYRPHSSLGNDTPVEFAAKSNSAWLRATPYAPQNLLKMGQILSM
jgi:putative transposase